MGNESVMGPRGRLFKRDERKQRGEMTQAGQPRASAGRQTTAGLLPGERRSTRHQHLVYDWKQDEEEKQGEQAPWRRCDKHRANHRTETTGSDNNRGNNTI